jgi:hypothetical protein
MLSLVGGIIALILGTYFFIEWFSFFIVVLKGILPGLFILGGILAAYLGSEELKDRAASGSLNDETADLKNQVESLKEEIKELRGEKMTSCDT